MKTENFTFLSSDGKTNIHAVKWSPDDGQYQAILQITHGMVEYIERYEEFAEFLTNRGYLVVGHDHLGHGASVVSKEEWGYFAQENPSDKVVADMHQLRTIIQGENEGVPYFMFGHSMGSYMLRKYLAFHNDNLRGAIICGTGYMDVKVPRLGMKVARFMAFFLGWHHRSKFIQKLSYDKPYQRYDLTGKDVTNTWLSKNEENVRKYYSDPRCTFLFTLNGYLGLFEAVEFSCRQENIEKVPKKLPLFIISGEDDPVGNNGVGVKTVYDMFMKAGMKDMTYKLYENDRHEILNETDREDVYNDIVSWLNVRIDT